MTSPRTRGVPRRAKSARASKPSPRSRRPVDIAVVGLGIGRHHANMLIRRTRGARLAALVDPDEKRLEAAGTEFDVERRYPTLTDLIADGGVDAVILAVPNELHAPLTFEALKAGLHVMVEKPMAMNARQAWKMTEEARARGLKLMLHLNQRFDRHSQQFRRIVERGDIGEPNFARTGWRRSIGIPGGWFSRKASSGGGPLIDLGVHMIDVTRYIMGNPRAVTVSGHTTDTLGKDICRRQKRPFDVEDLAVAFVRLENGAAMDIEISWAMCTADRESRWIEVYGTEGSVVFRNGFQYEKTHVAVTRYRNGKMTEVTRLPAVRGLKSPHGHFVDAIRNDTPVPAPAEEGAEMMDILDALYLSAERGREVAIRRRPRA